MTRKEAREQAFAIVFESSFHSEGLDYILENAEEGRDLVLKDGSFEKELAKTTIEKLNEVINKYANEKNQEYLSKIVPVLIEGPSEKEGRLMGYTDTMKLVNVPLTNDYIGKVCI